MNGPSHICLTTQNHPLRRHTSDPQRHSENEILVNVSMFAISHTLSTKSLNNPLEYLPMPHYLGHKLTSQSYPDYNISKLPSQIQHEGTSDTRIGRTIPQHIPSHNKHSFLPSLPLRLANQVHAFLT